jgi:hypothetical protein
MTDIDIHLFTRYSSSQIGRNSTVVIDHCIGGAQGQLATYKEMAAAAEDDRGRLEAEVVATAQLATAVEARLRGALAAKDAAESCVAAAELRAHQARISAALKARLRLGMALISGPANCFDCVQFRRAC